MKKLLILTVTLLVSNIHAYEYKKLIDPITDEVTAFAKFNSDDGKSTFTYICNHGTPIIVTAFADDKTTANPLVQTIYRFDKKEPIKVPYSTVVLSNPDYDDLTSHYQFMQELTQSKLLAVRMNTFAAALLGLTDGEYSETGVFNIQGINKAVLKVNKAGACAQITEYPKLIAKEKAKLEAKKQETAIEDQRNAESDLSEKQAIMAAIQMKVDHNWLRPPNTDNNLNCEVRVRLGGNGSVLLVSITRSSGNLTFDRSVEAAIYKSDPLPMPTSTRLLKQFRDIRFVFKPSF